MSLGDADSGITALVSCPSMLGAVACLIFEDYGNFVGEPVSRYVMDVRGGPSTIRVPMSSWQATLNFGSASYVQCVVPAADAWGEHIAVGRTFVISRQAVLPSGEILEQVMAQCPIDTVRSDRGPNRYTLTISGYAQIFGDGSPPSAVPALRKVRSISGDSAGWRVRCAIDWTLQPGMEATAEDVSLEVAYINYYVNGTDAFMDVGERN